MEFGKKIFLNLSPTSINTFYQSPLLFHLRYISKVPDDTPVPICYGLSGNIVHDCLEKYAKGELNRDTVFIHFAQQWAKQGLQEHTDISGIPLDQTQYIMALIKGLAVVDEHSSHICEETLSFPFTESNEIKIGVKGIVDLQAIHKPTSKNVIIDYKTSNSVNQGKEFERQAMFYNYLIRRKGKPIPHQTIFHYLKLGADKVYSFSNEDIDSFEDELTSVTRKILNYGTDIANYPAGEIDDLFNSKKKACIREIMRRKEIG